MSFDGGVNGSDGNGSSPHYPTPDQPDWRENFGHGSGVDIASFAVEGWEITPGAGGLGYEEHNGKNYNFYYGGGGGGILVDGHWPGTHP